MGTRLTYYDMRSMYREGDTYLGILLTALQNGMEVADAIVMMMLEFDLDDEEVRELMADYTDCI